jgi:preprotein translocase subunit SecF
MPVPRKNSAVFVLHYPPYPEAFVIHLIDEATTAHAQRTIATSAIAFFTLFFLFREGAKTKERVAESCL